MIEEYVGIPFADGGRGPEAFDCWGLVKEIYRAEFSTEVEDYFISALDTAKVSAMMMKEKSVKWSKLEHPQRGALVTISMDMALPRYVVNHVGVYLGDARFIHTRKATGSLIERVDDFKWSSRIEGYYKYNG